MKTEGRTLQFRPRKVPSDGIPLGARSVGHYCIQGPWREAPAAKHFVQLFWGVEGNGQLRVEKELLTIGPGYVGVYMPGMVHDLRCEQGFWEYRWWTMDGPLSRQIVEGFGIRPGVMHVGRAPIGLFEELEVSILDLTPQGERRADAAAYALLTRAAGRAAQQRSSDPLVETALLRIQRHWCEQEFNVSVLARQLGVHRSTLARRFQHQHGISPVEYLGRVRVQNAMSLLKRSNGTVAEIAVSCGFSDPNYFSRVIRKRCGESPLEVRRG